MSIKSDIAAFESVLSVEVLAGRGMDKLAKELTKRIAALKQQLRDIPEKESENTWTVTYYADNGDVYYRKDVKFYEAQEALMSLSREAYENSTYAKRIVMS